MTNRVMFLAAVAVLVIATPSRAHAVCSGGSVGGFTQYMSGQIPDVILTSGVATKRNITPNYVSFPGTGGNCGIFARSTVPGTTVTDTYGCTGSQCIARPPGQYAAVGSAYPVGFDRVGPNYAGGMANYVPLAFDGSAPPGTQGFLELAYSDNDNGDLSTAFVFARIPIYVQASSAPVSAWGRIASSSSNVSGSRLIVSHPYLDGKPDARLFVSHVYNPNGATSGMSWNHRVAVEYDAAAARWTLKNLDNAAMPAGVTFNFRIDPTALRVCVPPASTGAEFTDALVVDDYNANDNKWATLIVTPISGGDHPVAVKYADKRWRIVYTDGSPLSGGTCFNVKVIAFSQYLESAQGPDLSGKSNILANNGVGEDIGGAGTGHTINGLRIFPFRWAAASAGLRMIHTVNLTPTGLSAPASPDLANSALWITQDCITTICSYPSRRWGLRHETGTAVPTTERGNLWAEPQGCSLRNRGDLNVIWDPAAAARNLQRRGVSFEEAKTALADANGILLNPSTESGNESERSLARTSAVRAPIIIDWICDGAGNIRIMSARKSTPNERRIYSRQIQ